LNGVDAILLLVVLAFAIQGLLRGLVSQCIGWVGIALGVWAGIEIFQWVGGRWLGAQPAVVFLALRWLVAILGSLAVSAVVGGLGERVGEHVRQTPMGWLDRGLGGALGAVFGVALCALALLGVLRLNGPIGVVDAAAEARLSRPIIESAVRVTARARILPFVPKLHARFVSAARRIEAHTSAL
jgi:membrane protein required for colicin V production